MPRDRFGPYVLTDEHGDVRVVEASFDYRNRAPVLQPGDERVSGAPPMARGSWLRLGPVLPAVLLHHGFAVLIQVSHMVLDSGRRRGHTDAVA